MRSGPTHVTQLGGDESPRFTDAPFAILPLGSIEYHGPAAPFGTDTTLAIGFAERLAARRDCLVFPPIAYTFVPRLTAAHGPAVSVEPETFLAYLTEVLRGIVNMGVRRLLVINGHSENQFALRLAAESATAQTPAASILICNWWRLAPAGLFDEADGHGHGGPLEISTVAAFEASGVSVPTSTDEDVPYEAPWWRAAAQVVGRGQAPSGFAGYHGRVSQIDPGKGERVIEAVTAELTRLVDDWLERAEQDRAP